MMISADGFPRFDPNNVVLSVQRQRGRGQGGEEEEEEASLFSCPGGRMAHTGLIYSHGGGGEGREEEEELVQK